MRVFMFVWLMLCSLSVSAACRTITLPNTDGRGGLIVLPANTLGTFTELVRYQPPSNATSVGLEFWYHRFPYYIIGRDLEQEWNALGLSHIDHRLDLLVYLSQFDGQARRIFQTSNTQPNDPPAFHQGTFIHPGELFQVIGINTSGHPTHLKLIVTIRECMP